MEQEFPKLRAPEDRQAERASLLRIVRAAFVVIFATVMILSILDIDAGPDATRVGAVALKRGWTLVLIFGTVLLGAAFIVDAFSKRKRISSLFSIVLGLLVALLATYAMSRVIDLLDSVYDIQNPTLIFIAKILIGITFAYLCISTIIQTQDDFRLVIPYVEFSKQIRGPRPMLLDSSALIDARIADLGETGVIQQPIVIPHFVVAELQLLADSSDKLKRARGRRGLDIIAKLQRSANLDVSIDETPIPGKAVDAMLVELAKRMTGIVVSADVGLNRVAVIQGVRVLNLNDVANSLKPALIPGEQLNLKLIKAGEQPGQGVGYLDDGTMVVAEDGAPYIGEQVTMTVTSTLQTSAGRLLFAKIVPEGSEPVHIDDRRQALPGSVETAPTDEAAADEQDAEETSDANPNSPTATRIDPPSGDRARTPFPPKPPNKRVNPARNPRR